MNYLKKTFVLYLLITVAADGLFFGLTDPAKVGSVWLIVGFVLAVATIYWLARGFVALLGLYSKALRRQHRRLVRAFTLIGAVLVGLQSMGQLTFRDLAILVPMVLIGYFYISYSRAGQERA